jgi:translation initiation factor 2B subunit (eIF-2B alpha/beta/delta family)
MPADWQTALRQIRSDRRSGASVLLGRGIEAGRLFLGATRRFPTRRLETALRRFTLGLVGAQPAMAPFLRLANELWLAWEACPSPSTAWESLHAALVRSGEGVDRSLRETVRRAGALVRPGSLVLTYSSSTAVRLALWQAMADGKRFTVVCSESRPMGEGVVLARSLTVLGIPVHLTLDVALLEWVERADLVLLGADAILPWGVVNKVGSGPLLQVARLAGVPAYVLADSSKWLPEGLTRFWRILREAPGEITRLRHPDLTVHNRYFGISPLGAMRGLVWEGGIASAVEVKRRIARLPVSISLVEYLKGYEATGSR